MAGGIVHPWAMDGARNDPRFHWESSSRGHREAPARDLTVPFLPPVGSGLLGVDGCDQAIGILDVLGCLKAKVLPVTPTYHLNHLR